MGNHIFVKTNPAVLLALLTLVLVSAANCGGSAAIATLTPSRPAETSLPPPPPSATAVPSPTPLPTLTAVPTAVPGGLFVDLDKSLGPVSRLVFGTNHGPWAVVPMDSQQAFLDSGLTIIRFPGGNWGDENDLDAQQIDQYIDLVRSIGAEPQINVRLRGGDPGKAAGLVKYTRDKDYNVKYWGIGNEPDLFDTKNKTWPNDRIVREWRAIAIAMREADPTIKLIGPEISQFSPGAAGGDLEGRGLLVDFLKANADLVDYVSVHRYPFPKQMGEGQPPVDKLLAAAQEWDRIIPDLRALIRETTGRDMPVAVTEFNSTWANWCCTSTAPDSLYSALYLGDSLGRMIRQRVDIVNQFCLQQSQGGLGLFGRFDPNPPYYVYQLYKRFGDELVVSSSGRHDVSIYAARSTATGKLTLIIFNLSSSEATPRLMIPALASPVTADVWLLDENHKAEKVGTETLSADTTVSLPAYSMSLYLVR
ncbi:MAG: GH39 family glycosyl hydrolase [Rudaea sp.]